MVNTFPMMSIFIHFMAFCFSLVKKNKTRLSFIFPSPHSSRVLALPLTDLLVVLRSSFQASTAVCGPFYHHEGKKFLYEVSAL